MTTVKQRRQLEEAIELIRSVVDTDHRPTTVRMVSGSVRDTVRDGLVLLYRAGRDLVSSPEDEAEVTANVREAWQALGFPGEPWEK
jgi:hypothetical protein